MRSSFMFLCLAVIANAYGASFDCGKAKSAVEKLICADATISGLDDELNDEFEIAIAQSADEGYQLKSRQRAWLVKRNRCTDAMCVRQSYETRIRELACSLGNTGSSIGALKCFGWKLTEAEGKLRSLEQLYARKVVAESNNPEYAEEVTANERKKWREYRDAYCALFGETEGGSDGWKNAWSASCAIEETEKRLTSLKQKLEEKK